MKLRTTIVILLLACAAIVPVAADSQVDIGVDVPVLLGVYYQGQAVGDEPLVHIPLPNLMYNYFWNIGPVKLGLGARIWSLLLVSGAYPILSAEFETDRLILNAHVGGGVFGYVTIFPGVSGIETGRVFLPEVSAAFRFTNWFSMGVAVLGLYIPELTESGMGYSVNVFGRFRVK